MGTRDSIDARFERWGQRFGQLLTVPALLVLLAAGIYAIGDAVLAPAPAPDHPGFVDTVLGSRAVVAAIRLAVIFAGVFVVISVVALTARGQWLTRVGPVQVSEPAATVDAEGQQLEKSLAQAQERIDILGQKIADSRDLLNRMSQNRKGSR
jgi:hypothetical protein